MCSPSALCWLHWGLRCVRWLRWVGGGVVVAVVGTGRLGLWCRRLRSPCHGSSCSRWFSREQCCIHAPPSPGHQQVSPGYWDPPTSGFLAESPPSWLAPGAGPKPTPSEPASSWDESCLWRPRPSTQLLSSADSPSPLPPSHPVLYWRPGPISWPVGLTQGWIPSVSCSPTPAGPNPRLNHQGHTLLLNHQAPFPVRFPQPMTELSAPSRQGGSPGHQSGLSGLPGWAQGPQ